MVTETPWRVSVNGGTSRWMVYRRKSYEQMDDASRVTPHLRKPPRTDSQSPPATAPHPSDLFLGFFLGKNHARFQTKTDSKIDRNIRSWNSSLGFTTLISSKIFVLFASKNPDISRIVGVGSALSPLKLQCAMNRENVCNFGTNPY